MLTLAFCFLLLVAPEPKEQLSAAFKGLRGEWRAVSVEEKGEAWTDKDEIAEVVIEITGDTLIYKRNKAEEKFRFVLDSKQKPARIDLRLIGKGVDPSKACHGIYSLEAGKLKLCLGSEFTANDPEERPTDFKTGGEQPPGGSLIFVMERIKK